MAAEARDDSDTSGVCGGAGILTERHPHALIDRRCSAFAIALRLRFLGGRFERPAFDLRVITAAIGISLLCNPAVAQQVDSTTPVAQSRKAYDDCVYESVAAQLQQLPINARRNADISFMGEQGFLACATEERTLAMLLTISDTSPQMIQTVLLGIRGQIKRTLRDIVANPQRYAK